MRPAATRPPEPVDGGWPRDHQTAAGTVTVYQPQLESWDGHRLAVYAAIAVKEKPDSAPVFGVVWVDGPTAVDREARLVTFFDAQVRRVSFPSRPGLGGAPSAKRCAPRPPRSPGPSLSTA